MIFLKLFNILNNKNMGNSQSNNIDGADCSECAEILNDNNIKTLNEFRKWSLKNHPDKGGDMDFFGKVSGCADEYFKQKNCEEILLTNPVNKNKFKQQTNYSEPSEIPRYTGPPRYTSKKPSPPSSYAPRQPSYAPRQPSPPRYTERQPSPPRYTNFDKEAERIRREYQRREKQEREEEKFDRARREYEQRGFGRERDERERAERVEKEKERQRVEKEKEREREIKERVTERREKERTERERENQLQKMKIISNNRKNYVKNDIIIAMTKYADNIYSNYLTGNMNINYIDTNRKIVVDTCLKMATYIIDKNENFKNFMNGEDIPGINEMVILKAIERYVKENMDTLIKIAQDKFDEDL